MAPVLEVITHPTGPWLVKAGDIQYAVPPRLGRAMQSLAGRSPEPQELHTCLAGEVSTPELETWVRALGHALEPGPTAKNHRVNGRPIRFRIPLLTAPLVCRLAGVLKVLSGNRGLTFMGLLGGTGYLIAGAGPGKVGFSWDLGSAAAGLGLFVLTAIWHELGHAAALARSGYPPGGIGAGVLFVIPVLFADVTAVGVLPRAARLRVDVSGVIFQIGLGGALMALAGWTPFTSALTLAGSSALLAILWSLFPFIRSDGYWLLCDLLGLEDLDRPPAAPISRGLRVFLVAYQLVNAAFLLIVGVYFPLRMTGLLFGLAHRAGIAWDQSLVRWLGPVVGLAFMGMVGIGVIRRVGVLVRSARVVARGPQVVSPQSP